MVRSILGDNASLISTVHITVEDSEPLMEIEESSWDIFKISRHFAATDSASIELMDLGSSCPR